MKVEDDLAKLPSLRQQFMKEKASLDRQLTNTTNQQIDLIMSNLSNLNQAVAKLNNIKANIAKVNHVFDDSITNVKDYETIKKMTAVNQFLNQVNALRIDIENFRRYLNLLNNEIEKELNLILQDLAYPLTNILTIHYQVNQTRNFLDYLQLDSGLSDDLRSIVYKIVAPLKKTIRLFDELLTESIISITESAREGNLQLVFKIIAIIEYEANEDLKLDLMSSLNLNGLIDLRSVDYKNFRSARRDYKKFFFDKMKDGLNDTFNKCIEHFSEDKMLVFENLNWLEEELVFVHQELNPIFPDHWELSNFIQNVYYNNLHKFTMGLINSDPPAEDLMGILKYDAHYSKFIGELQVPDTGNKKRKSLVKKEQRSIMGEELKNSVLEDYMKVIILRNDEWNKNLITQEAETFTQRTYPPDKYVYHQTIEDEDANDQLILVDVENEVYVLPDFKTPLTMLKEQADVAADSGYSKILVGVVENWATCYVQRIQNYQKIIEDEFARYMTAYTNQRFLIQQSKTERFFRLNNKKDLPPVDVENMTPEQLAEISREGLIEYLAALGNTYEINTDRLQDKFLERYKEKVHTSYHARLDKAFNDIMTPSTELNAQVIRTIVDIIINDIYPALSQVFSKSWLDSGNQNDDSNMANRIIDTIAEYLSELRSYSSYDIYLVTTSILLDSFVSDYIRIGYESVLYGSGKKIDPHERKKYKSFSEAIGRDVTIFYDGLAPLFTRKDTRYLLGSLRAIEFLGEMATCDNPLVSIPQFWEDEILPAYYYCSVEYVRGILMCRKDMDKSTTNQIITEITKIQQDYHKNVEPTEFPMSTLTNFSFN
jgi:archaellum component FlaC